MAQPDGITSHSAERKAVTRQCALTRAVLPVDDLVRFVIGPDDVLVPDIRNKLPGRGVWVTASRALVEEARAKKAFARSLKAPVKVPDTLAGDVAELMKRDALQMLSLANKAGGIITGFDKIEGTRGPFLALVQASDGSRAEIMRLRRACHGRGPSKRDPEAIEAFHSVDLALSIGREHVIHAALKAQDVCAAFLSRARRYAHFLADDPAKPANASTSGQSVFDHRGTPDE